MLRAEGIPVFQKPPLNEVALGIQFMPARGYQQIRAGEVWALFREEYPNVEEHQALQPTFEIFGGPPGPQFDLGFVTGATHDRFWFIAPDQKELIQFQSDKLLHNWRKLDDARNRYPRFEKLVEKFRHEAEKLERYFATLATQRLNVNQCEISYTNHIPVFKHQDRRPDAWLRFVRTGEQVVDDFSAGFRRVIRDSRGEPTGRLICQAANGIDQKGQPIIVLSLSARGKPREPNLEASLEFLAESRDMLVSLFAEVTTDSAHMQWERVR